MKYINTLVVFLVSGLWHGSTWNFVLWGLINGLIVIIEDPLNRAIKKINNKVIRFVVSVLLVPFNIVIVSVLFLNFRYTNINEIINLLKSVTIAQPLNFELIGLTFNEFIWLNCVLIIIFITDILRYFFDMIKVFNKLIFPIRWVIYALLIAVFLVFGVYGGSFDVNDFIYRWF